jgi:hypothetical protein
MNRLRYDFEHLTWLGYYVMKRMMWNNNEYMLINFDFIFFLKNDIFIEIKVKKNKKITQTICQLSSLMQLLGRDWCGRIAARKGPAQREFSSLSG